MYVKLLLKHVEKYISVHFTYLFILKYVLKSSLKNQQLYFCEVIEEQPLKINFVGWKDRQNKIFTQFSELYIQCYYKKGMH